MNNVLDFFKAKGTPELVEGNNPLLLNDPQFIWLVMQGKVNIFLTSVENGTACGARSFLFEARANDLLFGFSPKNTENNKGIIASGFSGTQLLKIPFKDFEIYAKSNKDMAALTTAINRWLVMLSHNVWSTDPPQIVFDPHNPDFLKVRIAADEPLIPIADYHELALQEIVTRLDAVEQTEQERFSQKAKQEQWYMENALGNLASVTQTGQNHNNLTADSNDPLIAACQLVGHAMKIKIFAPPASVTQNQANVLLDDIARSSQVRIRQVVLKGEWWNQDNGPLLAYMEEDNRPVALIPQTPTQYQLHDPANNRSTRLDIQAARQLKPLAYTFYRPFPQKALSFRDILTFSLENCWKKDLWTLVITGILGGLLGLAIPIATGIVFDTIIPQGEKAQLLQVAFILGAGALGTVLFQLTRSFAMLRVEGKIEGSVQAAVWDRLLSLPVPFFKQFTSGELAMRAMGISQIRMLLTGVTVITLLSSIFSIFSFGLLFYYSLKLALIAFLLVLAALLITVFLGLRQIKYERQVVDLSNSISGLVLQLISSVSKFKVAGAEKRAFYLWSREFGKQRKLTFKKDTFSNYLETFNAVFPVASTMIIFYAVASAESISLAPGKFIAFNAAFSNFMLQMVALTNSIISVSTVIPLYERAKPILETLPEYDEAKANPGELTGDIEVSHVSFRYNNDGPLVLNDISLQISTGEYIGIVGTSGSGKSTLFRILLGFEKPESGRVYYSGQDLEKVDIRAVRKQLGVVLQNGKLMSGDIYTNIIGANPQLNIDNAWEAARMAGLDQDIEDMPMGMHTMISEGGGTFSGGQKQRLLIARAVVNKPKILYFDEATSALDNHTQAIVSQSLNKLKATRVVIAHRLSTIVNCDRIFVMDKGRLIENGSYKELMDMNGVFAELARRQLA